MICPREFWRKVLEQDLTNQSARTVPGVSEDPWAITLLYWGSIGVIGVHIYICICMCMCIFIYVHIGVIVEKKMDYYISVKLQLETLRKTWDGLYFAWPQLTSALEQELLKTFGCTWSAQAGTTPHPTDMYVVGGPVQQSRRDCGGPYLAFYTRNSRELPYASTPNIRFAL